MLPIKLRLSDDFFREEVRCGYTVGEETKRLWAVELDLLNELLDVCRKHLLPVYAGYGTLLGAIRHDGFIPWDDDIDVLMKRDDYERLCEIAGTAFSSPYFFQTEYTDIGFSRSFARLRNSETTAIQTMEMNGNIKYNQGVFLDIFPMDYVPDSPAERRELTKKALTLRNKAIKYSLFTHRCGCGGENEGKLCLKKLVSGLLAPVLKAANIYSPYIVRFDKLARESKKSNRLAVLWFCNQDKDTSWDESYFGQPVYHPFEMLNIPVPAGYDKILTADYGDWRTPMMQANDHGELIVDTSVSYREYKR